MRAFFRVSRPPRFPRTENYTGGNFTYLVKSRRYFFGRYDKNGKILLIFMDGSHGARDDFSESTNGQLVYPYAAIKPSMNRVELFSVKRSILWVEIGECM